MKSRFYFGMLFMLAFMCTTFISCGKDDSPEEPIIDPQLTPTPTPTPDPNHDPNFGADNFTDVAVTGGVDNVTATTATLFGYVNLTDVLMLSMGSTLKIGIEVSKSELMENATRNIVSTLEGNRKISVELKSLIHDTKYFYRTFVDNGGVSVYGNTLSFKTLAIENITTTGDVSDISPISAKVFCGIKKSDFNGSVGVAYSTDKSNLTIEKFATYNEWASKDFRLIRSPNIDGSTYSVELSSLTQSTTYYYCSYFNTGTTYCLGEIRSFSTPSVYDYSLISANVKCVPDFTCAFLSYKLDFKRNDLELGDIGIAVSETMSTDTDGRLIDQFDNMTVSERIEFFTVNAHTEKGYIFPWGNIYNITFPLLEPEKKYYYQVRFQMRGRTTNGYLGTNYGYAYDKIREFSTKSVSHRSGSVDMGVSVKWGACNIGASTPEENGGYYMWGSLNDLTSVSITYPANYYEYYLQYDRCKNIGLKISGTDYDVAHVTLGGGWRMPTYDEFIELDNNTTRYRCYYRGVWGYVFESTNGNSIFMISQAEKLSYWTGTGDLNRDGGSSYAQAYWYKDNNNGTTRWTRLRIRPVCE